MMDYIDSHRDLCGVEAICRVLSEHGSTAHMRTEMVLDASGSAMFVRRSGTC